SLHGDTTYTDSTSRVTLDNIHTHTHIHTTTPTTNTQQHTHNTTHTRTHTNTNHHTHTNKHVLRDCMLYKNFKGLLKRHAGVKTTRQQNYFFVTLLFNHNSNICGW